MDLAEILRALDAEIARLQQARQLLGGSEVAAASSALPRKRRGRPPAGAKVEAIPAGKRTMSEEGKARVAAAQKKRWAKSSEAAKVTPPVVARKKAAASAKEVAAKKATAPVKKAVLAKRATAPAKKAIRPVKTASPSKDPAALEHVEPIETSGMGIPG